MRYILLLIFMGIFGNYYIFFLLSIFLIVCYILKNKKILIPKSSSFALLTVFELLYLFFSLLYNTFEISIFLFPILFYYDGFLLIEMSNNACKKKEYIFTIIKSIIFGLFIHGMLNYFNNLNSVNRNVIDYWTNTPLSATLQAMLVVLYNSLLFYYLFYERKITKKILYLVGFVFSLLYLFLIATRTGIIIILVTLVINVIYSLHLSGKLTMKKLFFIIIIVLILIFSYNKDIFNIKSMYEKSNLYYRINDNTVRSSDDHRFYYQINTLNKIFESFIFKPDIKEYAYAHNMWLDIGKNTGILPFLFLFAFSVVSIVQVLKYTKYLKNKNGLKIAFVSMIFALNVNFFVEPIVPLFLGVYCFIIGMTEANYRRIKKERNLNHENIMDN